MFAELASFALVAGLLTITPGLDTALVLRTAVAVGPRGAMATALGINTGALCWGVAASVGATAVLAASDAAYLVLRIAGAGYLLWLGLGMLWRSRPGRGPDGAGAPAPAEPPPEADPMPEADPAAGGDSLVRLWWRGTATNLLNPKFGVFYMAMLPQFIPDGAPQLLTGIVLTLVHDLEGLVWFGLLVLGVRRLRERLAHPAVRRAMDAITGTALVLVGVDVALSERPV
ncbi:LysE family translocator [Streptomyces solicathayae]|uniref:LysE family translocator n=1 Tax=Streptomyces solicathayae TaxID=3081768 RepID=A0ABZ0M2J8_9ACTN|nr:LysE family translocator [Streptomyces sp. HUAS YS2]WOX26005.1 LysE family translocator [Streptomyces sp. HUAS YS2]